MHVIVADAMQEFQVAEPVVLVVTVFMVDFCLLIHGEEQSAMHTSSALMLEEFSSGCVQSEYLRPPSGLKYFSTTHLALLLACRLFAQRSIFHQSRWSSLWNVSALFTLSILRTFFE